MAQKSLKIGLALSGGSTWGIAHVGAIAALQKHDIKFDYIAGTSAGSVVAAPLAFGIPVATIEDAAKKLEWKQIARFAYSRLGFRSNASLAKLITDLVGNADIKDAKIPLAIVATDIEKSERKVFRQGNVALAVCASSAIPGYFAPIEIDGVLYVDGGISENLPLSPLKDMGADFTIGINLASFPDPSKPANLGEVVARSFDMLFWERDKDLSSRIDVLIAPDISSFHPRSFADAEAIYHEGFRAAEAAVPMIKTKLALRKAERSNFWKRAKRFFSV